MSDGDWKARLGWGPDFEAAMAPYAKKGLSPARVTLVYRKQLKVLVEGGERWARTGGKVLHRAESFEQLPAVGDWVAAGIPEKHGDALAHAVLPRRSAFVRKVPGRHAAPQVLATNVDAVLIVMGLDQDFNLRRLERFLSLAHESKAAPVVVLNKADLTEQREAQLAEVQAIATGAPVHVVSAKTGEGLDAIRAVLAVGRTLALLGSSGVGKSTLVNRLAGLEVMETGETKDDGRGRHTTTRRELLVLPQGGCVIDTPGLREVQMWDSGGGVAKTFDDIEALAQGCRFGDCRHDAEPGCAVKQALEDGTLAEARFDSWLALQRELEWLKEPAATRGRLESRRRERARKR